MAPQVRRWYYNKMLQATKQAERELPRSLFKVRVGRGAHGRNRDSKLLLQFQGSGMCIVCQTININFPSSGGAAQSFKLG